MSKQKEEVARCQFCGKPGNETVSVWQGADENAKTFMPAMLIGVWESCAACAASIGVLICTLVDERQVKQGPMTQARFKGMGDYLE